MSEIRIEMTSHGRGKVFVDGKEVTCRSVSFCAAVGSHNVVVIEMIPDKVTITGPADVADQDAAAAPADASAGYWGRVRNRLSIVGSVHGHVNWRDVAAAMRDARVTKGETR